MRASARFVPIVCIHIAAVLLQAAELPRATPESVGVSGEKLQAVTALLRQFVADRKISSAVAAVARKGKLIYLEPVGLQNVERKRPMTNASLFCHSGSRLAPNTR